MGIKSGWFKATRADKTSTFVGNLTINGNLTVSGNFTFGDASTDDLTVAGTLNFQNDVVVLTNAGAPTSGASGTGNGTAGIGSFCIDRTNGNLYLNIAAKTSPNWKLVTRAA